MVSPARCHCGPRMTNAISRAVMRAALGTSRIPFVPPTATQVRLAADIDGFARPPAVRIDFGDGECVQVKLKHQPDFAHMLHSVGAAGVRRRAANGFPTNDAPLLRQLEDVDGDKEYMVWPRTADDARRD